MRAPAHEAEAAAFGEELSVEGAAALVLTDVETAMSLDKAVLFRGTAQVNDYLPLSRRDIIQFEGCELAWKKAFAQQRIFRR